MAYDIGTGIESLILATVLALVVSPVRELDGGVGARGGGAWERADLVALVARLDLGDVLDYLLRELALCGGIFIVQCQLYRTISMWCV